MGKQNLRNIHTKKLIKDAVLHLLQTKPINKITVTEVCKIAQIDRGTFYLHFIDCHDVLEHLQEEYCDKVISVIEQNRGKDKLELKLIINQIPRDNEEDYLIFMRSDLPMHSLKKLANYGKQILVDYICANSSLSKEEADWIAYIIIAGDIAIRQRFAYETEDNLNREHIINEFVKGGLMSLFDKKE